MYRYFPAEFIQTYILQKVELFDKQYEQVFGKYASCVVIKENDFFSDFLRLLGQVSTEYILFGVDDVVYFDSVDIDLVEECFAGFGRDIFGFSLRLGPERIKAGGDVVNQLVVGGQTVYSIDWMRGRTPAARYPFELCATIYPTALVKRIIESVPNGNPVVRKLFSPASGLIGLLGGIISTRRILKSFGYFFSPNTLESWNCRWCQNHSDRLPAFLYFQKQCAAAIQVNMVNTSTYNTWDDCAEYTVETLAEKYKQGYRLDIDFVSACKPAQTHCGRESFRLVKT